MTSPRTFRTILAATLLSALVGTSTGAVAQPQPTVETPTGTLDLITVSTTGEQAGGKSSLDAASRTLSANGRYVVFASSDPDLVRRDTNQRRDVFIRDRVEGTTSLVSLTAGGKPAQGASFEPTISASGRYVAFTSWADNLVPGSRKGVLDVFVKDLQTGKVQLASQSSAEDAGEKNSFYPQISANGRHVAFQTFASFSQLDDDRREDVYVRHLPAARTEQASITPDGGDVQTGVLVGGISDDGTRVSYGNRFAVSVRDTASDSTYVVRRELGHDGSLGRPAISGDGQYIAVSSLAANLFPGAGGRFTEVVRIHIESGKVDRVSVPADGESLPTEDSFGPTLDRDGSHVAFVSISSTIVSGDSNQAPDVFVRDLNRGRTVLVSGTPEGQPGNSHSGRSAQSSISRDGSSVVFTTYSTDMGFEDTNDAVDILTWTRHDQVPLA